jgi:hypothetical protein
MGSKKQRNKHKKRSTTIRKSSDEGASLGIRIPGKPEPPRRVDIALEADPELADLVSIFNDLGIAGMTAHHITEPVIQETKYVFLRRACWESAIISYARCFGGGQGVTNQTRTTLHSFVDQLPEHLREVHDQLLALRDKRIGHHVSPHSGQDVSMYFGLGEVTPGSIHLDDIFVKAEADFYDTELMAKTDELTTFLRGLVGARIDELRFALFHKAKASPGTLRLAMETGRPWKPL